MAKYEVWDRKDLSNRKGLPKNTFATLDFAMDEAKKLSKGTTTTSIYKMDKKKSYYDSGSYVDVEVPNSFAVVERGDKQSVYRGWGVNGKFFDARDCKRCNNSGSDPNSYQELCGSCSGSSFKPKV